MAWCSLAVCLCCVSQGCSDKHDAYDTIPVTGLLTCEGKPVPNAVVSFRPVKAPDSRPGNPGRMALGETDENGRFTLTTYEPGDGANIGTHVVMFEPKLVQGAADTVGTQKFGCKGKTIEVEVKAGMEELNLEF